MPVIIGNGSSEVDKIEKTSSTWTYFKYTESSVSSEINNDLMQFWNNAIIVSAIPYLSNYILISKQFMLQDWKKIMILNQFLLKFFFYFFLRWMEKTFEQSIHFDSSVSCNLFEMCNFLWIFKWSILEMIG